MSWVLLSLRKSELKMQQSQYVARDLQISREQRQDARRYQLEQMLVRNDMRDQQNSLYNTYKQQRDSINEQIKSLRESNNNMRSWVSTANTQISGMSDGDEKTNLTNVVGQNNTAITNNENEILTLQTALNTAKENYEMQLGDVKTQGEDDMEILENEANDVDTMHEEEKVEVETQLEAIKQELQTVSDAVSQYIQSEGIKI